jgi:hypothetical protein
MYVPLVANVTNLITILWVYWGPLYISILGGIGGILRCVNV